MFNAILVPLDGSPLAEQALPVAARLARAAGATLHLAHVHVPASPRPISIEGLPVIDQELHSLAAEHERVYLERAAASVAGAGLRTVTARLASDGPVAGALCAYAREAKADLIVMTTHGRSGFAHMWLGSVAEALVHATCAPLLLLRPDEAGAVPHRPLRRVLAPLDGSAAAEEVLPYAAAIAGLAGGELVLAQLVAGGAHEAGAAEGYLGRVAAGLAPARAFPVVREAGHAAEGVIALADELGADMVALTTHGRTAAPRAALGGVADRVLRAVALPLLVLRPSGPAAR
ncbi:MAG TPA: universal stress protein [Chloroflexaceae bacterium]|nr:universal stress protein [Chloroflexaceae bacterium]